MVICDNVIYSTSERLSIPSQQSYAKLACRPLTCTQGVVSEPNYYKTERDSLYCSFNLYCDCLFEHGCCYAYKCFWTLYKLNNIAPHHNVRQRNSHFNLYCHQQSRIFFKSIKSEDIKENTLG